MSGNNHLAYADGHVLVNYIYYEITLLAYLLPIEGDYYPEVQHE